MPAASHHHADIRTYSNHTFVNDLILQPCFSAVSNGQPTAAWDRANIEALKAAYPGYTIYPIDVREFDGSGGALHCVTKQIPADNPVRILHKSVVGNAVAMRGHDIPVSAIITNRSGISHAECIYRVTDGDVRGDWDTIALVANGNKFSGLIPTADLNDRIIDTAFNPFTYMTARPDLLVGTPAGRTDAVATSAVGSYAITLDSTSLANTLVSVTNGTLVVGKATATVIADDAEVRQDGEMPELTWTVEGLKNGETADDVFLVQPVCQTDGTPDSPLGSYVINVSGAQAENYDFVYVSGRLIVSVSSGISDITDVAPYDIYNLQGVKVRDRSDSLDGLPAGIYIMNRQKVYIGR